MTDEAKRDEVRSWLRRATSDLRAAKILANDPSPLPGVAVYHCQQGAEKALKGFLVSHDVRVAKTHNLQSLIDQAKRINLEFGMLEERAARLTPFAFLYRYPGLDEEPDMGTVLKAIDDAGTIVRQVFAHLAGILTPEQDQGG